MSALEPILFLTHRIPFPPNKGDKIRSHHLLRYLASRYRVFLGTFVDDAADRVHIADMEKVTAGHHVVALRPALARVWSLRALLRNEALTLAYYRDRGLHKWVQQTVRSHGIRKAVVFSSAMAQYTSGLEALRVVADFCDVDSAKWTQYARGRTWPASWIYRREGTRLLAFERAAAARSEACVLATVAEAELFARLAPELAGRLHTVENGVDSEFFAPSAAFASPFAANEAALVFTGVMDYWPNVDAVCWFAREVLPQIAARRPDVRFYVVGMNPTPDVRALCVDPRVVVTGKVDDVRPFLQHAATVVAPLRVARGVQNKVLEAMAMARPVVASTAAATGIAATIGEHLEAAGEADDFTDRILRLLDPAVGEPMGVRARERIVSTYRWQANLERFGRLLLDGAPSTSRQASMAEFADA
jgi:sugar transferase (PEP-CTERM/EpsH1 system associated)